MNSKIKHYSGDKISLPEENPCNQVVLTRSVDKQYFVCVI